MGFDAVLTSARSLCLYLHMNSSTRAVLFICCCCIVGCSQHGVMVPLKVGNSFTTQREYFDFTTNKLDSSVEYSVTIVATKPLLEEIFYETDRGARVTIRNDGYWIWDPD